MNTVCTHTFNYITILTLSNAEVQLNNGNSWKHDLFCIHKEVRLFTWRSLTSFFNSLTVSINKCVATLYQRVTIVIHSFNQNMICLYRLSFVNFFALQMIMSFLNLFINKIPTYPVQEISGYNNLQRYGKNSTK